ncbi:MAG: universal stress protein [Actinomycetota bacterium]|nr:universal stress protein [Actinomycetota bacterium]NNN09409.1 universal stress protein [Acidimicrobiaceae bacterium]
MTNEKLGEGDSPSGMFRRLLVGFDGSNEARRAFRVARSLAADVGGDVHVLLIVKPRAHAETTQERQVVLQEEQANLSRGLDAEKSTDARDATPFSHVVFDNNPANAIVQFAKEHGFDLIVVGTHGQEQMMHRGVGHSLEELIRAHECPVLVV